MTVSQMTDGEKFEALHESAQWTREILERLFVRYRKLDEVAIRSTLHSLIRSLDPATNPRYPRLRDG